METSRHFCATTGLLSSVTDPNNQAVNYTYDSRRRVTNVKTTQDGKVYQNSYAYSNDRLASVSHNTTSDACDVTYTFGYDAVGRPTTVKVGTQVLSTNAYNDTGTLNSVTYGNGGKVVYAYDTFKRPTTVYYDSSTNPRYQCSYGSNGQVARVRDAILVRYIQSEYDSTGRPVRVRTTSGNSHVYTGEVGYDQYNNLAYFKEQVGTNRAAYKTTFTYDNENRPTTINHGDTANHVVNSYDILGRIVGRTVTAGGKATASQYTYVSGGQGSGSTTRLISTISQPNEAFAYTYDNVGNVASVSRNVSTTTCVYDKLEHINGTHVCRIVLRYQLG